MQLVEVRLDGAYFSDDEARGCENEMVDLKPHLRTFTRARTAARHRCYQAGSTFEAGVKMDLSDPQKKTIILQRTLPSIPSI